MAAMLARPAPSFHYKYIGPAEERYYVRHGATAANYVIQYVNGSLTVNPRRH